MTQSQRPTLIAVSLGIGLVVAGYHLAGTPVADAAATSPAVASKASATAEPAARVVLADDVAIAGEQTRRRAAKAKPVATEALPEGTVYDVDGLPGFVPSSSLPTPSATRGPSTLPTALSRIVSVEGAPADGYQDHILRIADTVSFDAVRAGIEALDGAVLRELRALRLVSVRVPVMNADALAAIDGVLAPVADAPVTLTSSVALQTAGAPTGAGGVLHLASGGSVTVDPTIAVAIVDSGVEAHGDLNIARHVHLSAAKTDRNDGGARNDKGLESLYLFDEDGAVIFDRAGAAREHLSFVPRPGLGMVHPDLVDASSLRSVGGGESMTMDLKNWSDHAIKLMWIDFDGNWQHYTTLQPGAQVYQATHPNHQWALVDASTDAPLAVIEDPTAERYFDYDGVLLQRHDEGALEVFNGTLVSAPEKAVSAACTRNNAMAFEAWITPHDDDNYNQILRRAADGAAQFVLRQYGDRLQARVGIEGGAVFAYSAQKSVVPGQPMHVVVRRDASGVVRLYVNGVQHYASGINRAMPLAWTGSATVELGDPTRAWRSGWDGEFGMVAFHCGNLSAGQVAKHYRAGKDAYVTVYDGMGHGTHIAGTIAGNGTMSGGEFIGVAPGAKVYDLRMLDADGNGTVSSALAAFDWLLANAEREGIRIVNLSIGKAVESAAADDLLVHGVEQLIDSGLVVVASAGNHGDLGHFYVTSPGNAPNAITVGALDDAGTPCIDDDEVAAFSSMGPTLYDHFLKPDLLAPGAQIVAPTAKHGKMKKAHPHRLTGCGNGKCDDEYFRLSGTSMATAVTSGAALLLLSDDSSLNPATVKARLMRSARKIAGDPVAVGAGVLDIEAALRDSGFAAAAPSPKLTRVPDAGTILIEDTAAVWGDDQWDAGYLWTDGDNWAQGYLWTGEDVFANGFLWTDGNLWANGLLWSDESRWAQGFLWSDGNQWANGLLWGDESPLLAQANDFHVTTTSVCAKQP